MTTSIPNIIKKRVFVYASYFDILFFFEIINLMFLLLMAYGKIISIAGGSILSVLLSLQIINLYFKKEINRKIQLYLMDIHLAYSVPFIINFIITLLFYKSEPVILNFFFVFLRFVISCFDLVFIVALSDYKEESYV
jgi:hypothetical protein